MSNCIDEERKKYEKQLIRAGWLMGFGAACYELDECPEGVTRADLAKHSHIAAQIITGGAFNPLSVWEYESFVDTLMALMQRRAQQHVADGRPIA